MMRSNILSVLIIVIVQAHAKDPGHAQDATDKSVDKMVGAVLSRRLSALHRTSLDSTRLRRRHTAVPANHPALPVNPPAAFASSAIPGGMWALPRAGHRASTISRVSRAPDEEVSSATRAVATLTLGAQYLLSLLSRVTGSPGGSHATLPGLKLDTCSAQNFPFQGVDSGSQLASMLDTLVAAGKMKPKVQKGLLDMHTTYKGALSKSSKVPDVDKEAAQVVASIADRVAFEVKDPYVFPSRHTRIVEPFNYYDFGQRFSGNLINFDMSFVGHAERIVDMEKAAARGENVILLANHQSEADPAIFAWMTNALAPSVATDIFYIAGDRVVFDTFAKPFSMGRNLICVHSKRHMEDDLALKATKMAQNQKSVRELGALFKKGGAVVWVAPLGGRDRKNASGVYAPGEFDPSAVMLLKRLSDSSKKATHIYPMAMASAEILPPPAGVEKKLGEERVMNYHGVGISVGEELNGKAILDGVTKTEQAGVYTSTAFKKVNALYDDLANVVYGKAKAGAEFTQPWKR